MLLKAEKGWNRRDIILLEMPHRSKDQEKNTKIYTFEGFFI